MSSYTGQCPTCPHPAHIGPCLCIHFYDRPGGSPGNQQCMCGHHILQSTITMTPCANCGSLEQQLRESRAALDAMTKERDALDRRVLALEDDMNPQDIQRIDAALASETAKEPQKQKAADPEGSAA